MLDITFNTKLEKYKELMEETKKQTGLKVIYEPIIVSSLGAISKKSSNGLKKIISNKQDRKRLEKKMSYDAVRGSWCIYNNMPIFDINEDDRVIRKENEPDIIDEVREMERPAEDLEIDE